MEERTQRTSPRRVVSRPFVAQTEAVSHAYGHAHVEVQHENHVDTLYRIEYADGIEFMNYVAYTQVKIKDEKARRIRVKQPARARVTNTVRRATPTSYECLSV